MKRQISGFQRTRVQFHFLWWEREPHPEALSPCSCSIEYELFEGQGCFFISSTHLLSVRALSGSLCPVPTSYLSLHDLVEIYRGPAAYQVLSVEKRFSREDTTSCRQSDRVFRWVWGHCQAGWWPPTVRWNVYASEAHGWGIEKLGRCLTGCDWGSRVEVTSRAV